MSIEIVWCRRVRPSAQSAIDAGNDDALHPGAIAAARSFARTILREIAARTALGSIDRSVVDLGHDELWPDGRGRR